MRWIVGPCTHKDKLLRLGAHDEGEVESKIFGEVIENGGDDSHEELEMMTLDALCCAGPPKRLRWT